jgi:cytochrome d ubiquinol oxidase subunit I
MALWLLTVLVPLQMVIGDAHGLNTREYQPAKLAAIETRWDTGQRVPLTLFTIPNEKAERNDLSIEIPWLGSLILTHDLDGQVKGLKDFPADQRPPVVVPFFAFRIMVGCAVIMLGVVLLGGWLRWHGRLYDTRLFLKLVPFAAPLGFVAVIAGWCVTEVGRQPWTVYGLLARRNRYYISIILGAIFFPPMAALARLMASFDVPLGRATTFGAAFVAILARKP